MGNSKSKKNEKFDKQSLPEFVANLRKKAQEEQEQNKEKRYQDYKQSILSSINKDNIIKTLKDDPNATSFDTYIRYQDEYLPRLTKELSEYKFSIGSYGRVYIELDDNLIVFDKS